MDKYDIKYWTAELERAEKARQKFIENGERSIAVYSGDTHNLSIDLKEYASVERKINCWWFVVNTLMPAYYSRMPEIECELRHEREQPNFLLAAQIIEKASQYQLNEENEFHKTAYHAILQYVLTGFGCLWMRYEAEQGEEELTYINEVGEEVTEIVPNILDESVRIESIYFKDYLCSDARKFDEVTWKARRAYLDEEEAKARFGKEKIKDIDFDVIENDEKTYNEDDDDEELKDKAEFWEIWCKESEQVYWIHKDAKEILEKSDPPLELDDFFPCSEIHANERPDTVVPVGDYSLAKDSILEVERLTERIHSCTQAIRANGVYDSALGDNVKSLMTGDFKFYPINNKALASYNRLQDGIEFLDVTPYTTALEVLLSAREEALNRVYEATGASDLIRGTTNPQETATAQALKSNYTSLRFEVRQRHIAEFLEQALNITGEIVAEQFSDQRIVKISNASMLLPQFQGADEGSALGILREDYVRRFSIGIKSDSMVALDERADRGERLELLQASAQSLKELMPLVQQYPELAQLAKEQHRYLIRSYRGHKELETPMIAIFDSIAQKALMAQQQPPPQAPPDPKIIESQARIQIAQMTQQTEMQKAQMEIQSEAQKAQMEAHTQASEDRIKEMELQYKVQALEIEREKLVLEKQKLEAELIQAQREAELRVVEMTTNNAKEESSTQNSSPPITINLPSGKKTTVFKTLDDGTRVAETVEEPSI